MAEDTLKFILQGDAARNGNIPGDVFVSKLRQFLTTMYAFDRDFARKSKRSIELEVINLERVNPQIVSFHPRATIKNYDANESIGWAFTQFDRIHRLQQADMSVSQATLDGVVELSRVREQKIPLIHGLHIEYRNNTVALDDQMQIGALALRASRQMPMEPLWHGGVSRGSLFGELRGVMDLDGERQFFVSTPNGRQVQCVFPERLRDKIAANLFNVVRISGFLRHSSDSPHPYLIEVEELLAISQPDIGDTHLADLKGSFVGLPPRNLFEVAKNGE